MPHSIEDLYSTGGPPLLSTKESSVSDGTRVGSELFWSFRWSGHHIGASRISCECRLRGSSFWAGVSWTWPHYRSFFTIHDTCQFLWVPLPFPFDRIGRERESPRRDFLPHCNNFFLFCWVLERESRERAPEEISSPTIKTSSLFVGF